MNLRADAAGRSAPSDGHAPVLLGPADLDRVEPLWRSMVEHHRAVVDGAWPVRGSAEAWRRRREQYVHWLESRTGWILAAAPEGDPSGPLAGYAMVCVTASGPTWDLGDDIGELESLVFDPGARGAGIGTMLIREARRRLLAQGIRYWSVGVVEANADATRLYAREGFRPFSRQLLGPTSDPGR